MSRTSFPAEDPLKLFPRIATKLFSLWLRWTYPFANFGAGSGLHYTCDVRRAVAPAISIGVSTFAADHVWLNIPEERASLPARLTLGDGCRIGRRCMITAKNRIVLESHVLLGPNVLIADHAHEFRNIDLPIMDQGVTAGGEVVIERNCWLGYGAAVLGNRGELRIGRNSVVAANAVVTESFPPYSVIAGSPAKLVRRFDPDTQSWVSPSPILSGPSKA